jgi:L-fucose mutarotase/ribose pyranase (RbsD/FucU family)
LVFPENKTVGRLKECFVVDLLEFFKNRTPEIRHLDRRHFDFFQRTQKTFAFLKNGEQKHKNQ